MVENYTNNKHKKNFFIRHELHNVKKKKKTWTPEGRVWKEKKVRVWPWKNIEQHADKGNVLFQAKQSLNGCNKFTENRPETNYVNKTWKEQELREFDNRLWNHVYSSREFWLFQIQYRGIWRKVQSQKLLFDFNNKF